MNLRVATSFVPSSDVPLTDVPPSYMIFTCPPPHQMSPSSHAPPIICPHYQLSPSSLVPPYSMKLLDVYPYYNTHTHTHIYFLLISLLKSSEYLYNLLHYD